jgi:O-antigen ligase
LFLFPFIFATSEPFFLSKEKSTVILFSFLAGCFTSTLLLYGHATYNLIANYNENAFYYRDLSWFWHPSYLAMYLTFAIAIMAYWLMEGYPVFGRFKIAGIILLIINFFVFIILLNSKAGLLSLLLVIIFYSVSLVVLKHNWILATVTLVLAVTLFCISLTLFPYSGKRLKEAGKELQSMDTSVNDIKSTTERIGIWKCSLEIISKHALFGVGTGDVKDALLERYKTNNLTKALNQNLNAHNQYLQTFISLGIFGLLALLFMLVFPAIQAFHQKYLIYFIFLLIFSLNVMVESMFEVQAGVIFYALFNALLYTSYRPDPSNNPFDILIKQT